MPGELHKHSITVRCMRPNIETSWEMCPIISGWRGLSIVGPVSKVIHYHLFGGFFSSFLLFKLLGRSFFWAVTQ